MSDHEIPQTPFPDGPLPVTPEEFLNLAEASACVIGALSDLAIKDPAALGLVLAAGLDEHGTGETWAPSLRRCVLALQRLAGLPANAGSVYELALDLANAGDWTEAERAARAALRVLPDHGGQSWPTPAAVAGVLARALLGQGQREEARAVALEARAGERRGAADPHCEDVREVLAELLNAGELAKLYPEPEGAAPAAVARLVNVQARPEWQGVIETFEANPLEAYELVFQSDGIGLEGAKLDDIAVWELLRQLLIGKHPLEAADCLYRMAVCLQALGNLEPAELGYRDAAAEIRAIGDDPRSALPLWWPLRNLVEVLLKQGKTEGLYALLIEAVDSLRGDKDCTLRELEDLAGQVLPHCNADQARTLREIFGELPAAPKGGA